MLGETMARRRSERNSTSKRETFDFANDSELLSRTFQQPTFRPAPLVHHTSPSSRILHEIEDRRTYHPDGPTRPARSYDKPVHRLTVPVHPKNVNKRSTASAALPRTVQFEAPKRVLVCIRRQKRKEVLFALKKTGKGARARKHRQSFYSSIRC